MPSEPQPASSGETATILMSFELSQKSWVITVLQPGSARLSRYTLAAADTIALAALLVR